MDELKELHERKNKDYATDANPYSNFEFASQLVALFNDPVDATFAAIIGVKLARLGELLGKGKTPQNESVRDTLRDLTCYSGIWTARTEDRIAGLDRLCDDIVSGLRESKAILTDIKEPEGY